MGAEPLPLGGPLSDVLFAAIFDASPIAKLLVDAAGTIRLANRRAELLFGWPREELVGASVDRLVPERFRDHHPALRDRYLAAPVARAMGEGRELFGLCRDGREVPVEIGLNPVTANGVDFVLVGVVDITQRHRAECALRASLAEKETLLREIHHRVKNNMQVVSSLLSLQQNRIDDPGLRGIFEECQTRVRTMALVHERLYSTGDLSALDGGAFVRDVANLLFRCYRPDGVDVRLDIDVGQALFDVQVAVPIGLVLHELVTNAMKHAFAGRTHGRLRITLRTTGPDATNMRLEVADDGVGLPAGFDLTLSRGLGFRMIGSLVKQIDGALLTTAGNGTMFVVSFAPRVGAPGPPT